MPALSGVGGFLYDRIPLIYVFISGIGFSLQTLIIKLLAEEGFHASFYCVFCRGIVQMSIVSIFIYFDEERRAGNGPNLFGDSVKVKFILLLRSLSGYGSIACAYLSAEYLPVGDSTVLVMMSPMVAAILGCFILGEPWKLPEFVGTVLSMVGAVLVSKPPFIFGYENEDIYDNKRTFYVGVVLALSSAICAGFAFIFIRMLGTTVKMPWANVCFSQALGQILLSPPNLYFSRKTIYHSFSFKQYLMIFSGGFIGAWSQIAMTVGMQREKSATATAMRMSDVIFGFIWQVCFTPDPANLLSVIGAILLAFSILIVAFLKDWGKASEESVEKSMEMVSSPQNDRPSNAGKFPFSFLLSSTSSTQPSFNKYEPLSQLDEKNDHLTQF